MSTDKTRRGSGPNFRQRDSRLRWYGAIGVVALLVAGYLLFETGRLTAGHNRFELADERRDFKRQIADLEEKVMEHKEQVVQLKTMRKADQEAYKAVEASLNELQGKIQEQREAIAFYRGIISPSDSNSGLRVQDLQVLRGADESQYRLRLVLAQVKQHHREIYGKVRLSVDGAKDGEVVSYPLSQLLAAGEKKTWNYGFRYFQDFERSLNLPEGFSPLTVNIELVPTGSGNVGLKQSFPWSTSPSRGES